MLRETISTEWYTILIVVCLCILAIAKYAYTTRFNDFLLLINNYKYLKIYSKQQKFIHGFDALLYTNLIISLSLFYFLAYRSFFNDFVFTASLFFKTLTGIGALILIKILVERLIASLFEIEALIDLYVFQKINYKNYIGLLLLPINIILCFVAPNSTLMIYITLVLIVFINSVGFAVSFKTHQNIIFSNLFYFILYLCALEIAPYIILYNLFTS